MEPVIHSGHHPAPGAIDKANEISKEHNLGKFFRRKLRIDAAKMKRLDPEEIELLHTMAIIYAKAMDAIKSLGKHANLPELHEKIKSGSINPLPHPITINAIEYLCHRMHRRESLLDKRVEAGKKIY